MAVDSAPRIRAGGFAPRAALAPSRTQPFQRGDVRARVRKVPRRVSLRARHVVLLVLAAAAVLFGISRAALFVLAGDRFAVREVELVCERAPLRAALASWLGARPLGNILFCDVARLRAEALAFPWVREARILRVFPSVLRVEVEARVPFAVLRRAVPVLVDREGVELEAAPRPEEAGVLVLEDAGGFAGSAARKIRTAEAALEALPEEARERLSGMDLSGTAQVGLIFRDDPVRLLVDAGRVREGYDLYRARKADWEGAFGPLAAADLRFAGRAILEPREVPASGGATGTAAPAATGAGASPDTGKETD